MPPQLYSRGQQHMWLLWLQKKQLKSHCATRRPCFWLAMTTNPFWSFQPNLQSSLSHSIWENFLSEQNKIKDFHDNSLHKHYHHNAGQYYLPLSCTDKFISFFNITVIIQQHPNFNSLVKSKSYTNIIHLASYACAQSPSCVMYE